jgi:polyphosphate kinase
MKMNSLTDKAIIEKLFEASQAGVKIQLIIRGICCLYVRLHYYGSNKFENVQVIYQQYLQLQYFHWYQGFPVEDKNIAARLLDFMNLQLSDNQKGRYQDQYGKYYVSLHRLMIGRYVRLHYYGSNKFENVQVIYQHSLTDKAIIEKLFEASQAGVKIQLIIRGICCLKPGIHYIGWW